MLNGESNLAFSIIFYDKMHVYSGKIANFALKILKIPIINTLFMKKLLLFAIAACVAFIAGATSYNMLNVHLADGTTVDVKLASDLKLTFTETHLVATGTGVSVEVPRESIAKFVHTFDAGSGIAEVAQDGMKFSGNTLSRFGGQRIHRSRCARALGSCRRSCRCGARRSHRRRVCSDSQQCII